MEEDLRRLLAISAINIPPAEFFEVEAMGEAIGRWRTETEDPGSPSIEDVVEYLNFGETFTMVNKFAKYIASGATDYVRARTAVLEKITPIRNRVMHGRPLHTEDFSFLTDTAEEFRRENKQLWKTLGATVERLRDQPNFVFGLTIPQTSSDEVVHHNLPVPEFDETGFIGRKRDLGLVRQAIYGPFPVVTIVGDGGQGKTSISLRAAYDILETDNGPFDAIVWTTARTKQLTATGIVEIENSIKNSIGLITDVSNTLNVASVGDPFERVLEYLKQYRVLLILDNLETVLDNHIRDFLSKLPSGSKVLITSRIGLGAYEYPIKLQSMADGDAAGLFRALARMRSLSLLSNLTNDRVNFLCKKMHNNPGFIRWFIASVQVGGRPEELLQKPDSFLDYCMSNVYEHLDQTSKKLLTLLQCVPRPLNQAEMAQLSQLRTQELQASLNRLHTTNMVYMTNAGSEGFESVYLINEFAREYLTKHHPPYQSDTERFGKRWATLVAKGEELKASLRSRPYDIQTLCLRSDRDLVVARLLNGVYAERDTSFEQKWAAIVEARQLAPDYFEVYRAEAWVFWLQKNYLGARESYEAAINLAPTYAPLRYHFAGLLLRDLNDVEGALTQILESEKLDSVSSEVKVEKARVLLYRGEFPRARALAQEMQLIEGTSEAYQRKLWDLQLTIEEKAAVRELQSRNFGSCLFAVKAFRNIFQLIPRDLRDRHMYEKAFRLQGLAAALARVTRDKNHEDAADLLKWLTAVSSDGKGQESAFLVGRIKKIGATSDFGFIRDVEDHDWYFNFRDVAEGDRHRIAVDSFVDFYAGRNMEGPCARMVRVSKI